MRISEYVQHGLRRIYADRNAELRSPGTDSGGFPLGPWSVVVRMIFDVDSRKAKPPGRSQPAKVTVRHSLGAREGSMGKFFREFNDRPQKASPSFIVMLLGTAMFGAMIWLLHSVLNGTAESFAQFLPR